VTFTFQTNNWNLARFFIIKKIIGNPFEVFPIMPGDDAGLLSDPKMLQIGRNTVEYLQSWSEGM
jgi:hypothetical protein